MSETRIGAFSQLLPPKPTWTAADVPDQTGKTVIVTGGNGGIGRETARVSPLSPPRRSLLLTMGRAIGVALQGRQSVYRDALTREVGNGHRGAQAGDWKRYRFLSQARLGGLCFHQGCGRRV